MISTTLLLVLTVSFAVILSSLFNSLHKHPNYPKTAPYSLPFLGHSLQFAKNPNDFIRKCKQQLGSVFNLVLLGKSVTFVVDPVDFKAIRKAKQLSFRAVTRHILSDVFSYSTKAIETELDTDLPDRLHSAYVTHLSGKGLHQLNSQTELILRDLFLQRSGQQGQSGLYALLKSLLFPTGVISIFGPGFYNSTPGLLQPAFENLDKAFPFLLAGLPKVMVKDGVDAISFLGKTLRECLLDSTDGVSEVIKERFRLKSKYHQVITDVEDVGVLWATLANAMPATYWTILYLLKSGNMSRIKTEVEEHLKLDSEFTREGMAKCVLLHSAIQETLRLISGSMIMREALEDVDLELSTGLVHLSKGNRIVCYPALAHNDDGYFEDAKEFKIERFLIPQKEYYPFGMGESLCPGRYWAVNEIKMVVALISQTMDINVLGKCEMPEFDWSRVGLGVYPPKEDSVMVDFKFK